eukprot:4017129-Pleurochrysis_carterae.AAC.1
MHGSVIWQTKAVEKKGTKSTEGVTKVDQNPEGPHTPGSYFYSSHASFASASATRAMSPENTTSSACGWFAISR